MQLSNITLRLGGSVLHTVPKTEVTPAEIVVLRHIHGDDAVIDVRPVKFDKSRRHEVEYERLATVYDRAASSLSPGDSRIMTSLFPGAMRKLPVHLKEIGLGHMMSPAAIAAVDKAQAEPAPVPEEGAEGDIFAPPADDDGEAE